MKKIWGIMNDIHAYAVNETLAVITMRIWARNVTFVKKTCKVLASMDAGGSVLKI